MGDCIGLMGTEEIDSLSAQFAAAQEARAFEKKLRQEVEASGVATVTFKEYVVAR